MNRLAMKQFRANGDDINHHSLLCHRRETLEKFMFEDENIHLWVSLEILAKCSRFEKVQADIVEFYSEVFVACLKKDFLPVHHFKFLTFCKYQFSSYIQCKNPALLLNTIP